MESNIGGKKEKKEVCLRGETMAEEIGVKMLEICERGMGKTIKVDKIIEKVEVRVKEQALVMTEMEEGFSSVLL